MTQGGFRVVPGELDEFAGHLNNTTHAEVTKAAQSVHSANGFDNNAFGVFAAQLLAVPARIAMGIVTDNLNHLAEEIATAAKATADTASTYRQHEGAITSSFTAIDKGRSS